MHSPCIEKYEAGFKILEFFSGVEMIWTEDNSWAKLGNLKYVSQSLAEWFYKI